MWDDGEKDMAMRWKGGVSQNWNGEMRVILQELEKSNCKVNGVIEETNWAAADNNFHHTESLSYNNKKFLAFNPIIFHSYEPEKTTISVILLFVRYKMVSLLITELKD